MRELPPGWAWTTLGEIAAARVDSSGSRSAQFTYIDITSIDPATKRVIDAKRLSKIEAPGRARQNVQCGDVLVSMTRPNRNAVAMVEGPHDGAVASTAFCVLRPLQIEPSWLYYLVQTESFIAAMCSRVQGALYPAIRSADVMQYRTPLPPRSEQRRISAEIEKQFTNIHPARIALESSRKKLDKLISASIIRTCLLSNPGEIRLRPVGSVGDVTLGRQRAPKHHNGPDMRPYLRVANVHEDRIETHDINQMNFTDAEFERYRLVEGDVLLNEGQSLELVGRPAIYRGEIPDCCFQNTLVRFKASPDVIPEYALYVFRAWLRAGEFRKVARWTTTMAHLGAERFAAMPFPLRPKASQQAIVEHLDASLSSIAHLGGEITRASVRAARLRQAILKKAFEGRLVPQDPNDEPDSILLQRIRSTRNAWPRLKKQENLWPVE